MTTLVSATRGLRLVALMTSDRLWFALAVALGLIAAGQIVELLLIEAAPDLRGVGL
jgi:hypothetical protein